MMHGMKIWHGISLHHGSMPLMILCVSGSTNSPVLGSCAYPGNHDHLEMSGMMQIVVNITFYGMPRYETGKIDDSVIFLMNTTIQEGKQ